MTNQKRAKVGGEYGINGEFYEGGKFLPSTQNPKKHGSYKATGKQEIEPYLWDVNPGYTSIYHRIMFFVDREMTTVLSNVVESHGYDPKVVDEYRRLYLIGWRWVAENEAFDPITTEHDDWLLDTQNNRFQPVPRRI